MRRRIAEAPAGRHPMDVAMDVALEMLSASREYVMPNQYDNKDNSRAHYESTGPEIWAQTGGQIKQAEASLAAAQAQENEAKADLELDRLLGLAG